MKSWKEIRRCTSGYRNKTVADAVEPRSPARRTSTASKPYELFAGNQQDLAKVR